MNAGNKRGARGRLLAVALLVLASGTAVYVFARAPGAAYMLPSTWVIAGADASSAMGVWAGSWPAFAHAFSFSLLTCLILPASRPLMAGTCFGWFTLECVFEAGQHRAIAPQVARWIGDRFDGIPVMDHLAPYFLNGSFDTMDVAFAGAGSLLAGTAATRMLCAPRSRDRR